jgi:hypothetical protein
MVMMQDMAKFMNYHIINYSVGCHYDFPVVMDFTGIAATSPS